MNPVNKQQARRKGAKRQAWHLGAGVALGIAAVGVGQPALAAVITTIDDFSDPQPILVADDAGTNPNQSLPLAGGMLGGTRVLYAEETTTSGASVDVSVVNSTESYYGHSQGAATGGYTRAIWDANGGCLNEDLSEATEIQVRKISADHDANIIVILSDGTNEASQLRSVNGSLDPVEETLAFQIAGFPGIGAVDLTDICSIQVEVDGRNVDVSAELDLRLDWVQYLENEEEPPPVPAISGIGLGAALLGLPLFGAMALRRRRRR